MTKLYLVRHGENLANITKEFSYRAVDYPLTPKGVLQAEQTAEYFADRSIDAIYASPLLRARQTAEILTRRIAVPVHLRLELREINVGSLEGASTPENWALYHRISAAWYAGQAEVAFPDGEDLHMVEVRFLACLGEIVSAHPNSAVVVVGHGGVYTACIALLCPKLDLPTLLAQPNHNCSITEVEAALTYEGQVQGVLRAWASYSHLHGVAAEVVSALPDDAS
ncbi:MAG TPA: histidine phosphatase family protein [Ktedonobacterales bacterium]|jgi:probable phosphoglycerate mutase